MSSENVGNINTERGAKSGRKGQTPKSDRPANKTPQAAHQRIEDVQRHFGPLASEAKVAISGNKGACLNEIALASRLHDLLQDVDSTIISDLAESKSDVFSRLAAAVNAQAADAVRREKLELDFNKYKDSVAAQKEKIQKAMGRAEKRGLSREILDQIEKAANLL